MAHGRYGAYSKQSSSAVVVDEALLNRVMQTLISVEKSGKKTAHQVEEIARKQRQQDQQTALIAGKQDAQSIDLENVSKITREVSVAKKIAVWAIGIVFPFLVTGVVSAFQGHQKLERLEADVAASTKQSAQMQYDVSIIETNLRVIAAEMKHNRKQDATLESLVEQLETLREENAPRRRRRR